MSHVFIQVSSFHLLPGDPGGERCSQCAVVSLPVASHHWRLCSTSTLRHLQQFPHRRGFHAYVLCLFPSQRATLWALAQRARSRPRPHCPVLHTTIWRCHQFPALQPRCHHNPGAWHRKVFWAGWLHASVSGPTHSAINAVISCSAHWRDCHQDRPL